MGDWKIKVGTPRDTIYINVRDDEEIRMVVQSTSGEPQYVYLGLKEAKALIKELDACVKKMEKGKAK